MTASFSMPVTMDGRVKKMECLVASQAQQPRFTKTKQGQEAFILVRVLRSGAEEQRP